MKEFVKALKLLPYGLRFRRQLIIGCIFFALGVVGLCASSFGDNSFGTLGGFYVAFSAMFLIQMIISMTMSDLVKTSPYNKKMQTLYPNIIGGAFSIVTYSIFIGIMIFQHVTGTGMEEKDIISTILRVNLMLFGMELYMAAVYKYYIASLVIVLVFIYSLTFSSLRGWGPLGALAEVTSFSVGVISGYVILFVGFFAAYGLSILLYKKPIDKLAFNASMKKGV